MRKSCDTGCPGIYQEKVVFVLKFTGIDNISDNSLLLIVDQDNVIAISDQAGNVTKITLEEKNRKVLMSADILSLSYNGIMADISNNKMSFLWLYDGLGSIKMFSQTIRSKNDYNITSHYDGSQTMFYGKDFSGEFEKTLTGLHIISVNTNKGGFEWNY